MTTEPTPPLTSDTPPPPNPGRRIGLGILLLGMVASATVAGAGVLWLSHRTPAGGESSQTVQAAKTLYQCPMHPSIVLDHPGECPICGMKLLKTEGGGEAAAGTSTTEPGKVLFYRSPMDPKVTSPTARKDQMGMDYVPVYAEQVGGPPSTVPGQAMVNIDPARQQLIGMTTALVTAGPVGGAWRTVGRVAMDETRVRHINVKVQGFIERIYVDFIGKQVRKGDPLFAVYSPELLSAQEEYLLALRTRGALTRGAALTADGDALVKASRRKLALWDIPDSEIDRLTAAGVPTKALTIYSPVSGVVTKKDVVEGMKLEAGSMPYEIVDLSTVWVLADVYESELRFMKQGMPASLTLNAFPNREFKGRVLFMDPLLDPKTRTVKLRLAFPNPGGDLRPEMFGEVVLHGTPREGLRIPQDAVIDSGTEKIVFVALGNGKFQPRVVRLGDSSGKTVEVVSGLSDGEEVVTRANFLIDSESKLRASLAEMTAGNSATVPERAQVLPGPDPEPPARPVSSGKGGGGEATSPHQGHTP